MDRKFKYCLVFLLLTVLTILAISTVSAVQADADDTGITDNTITTTASDSVNTVTQADNNIKESQTTQKEAETSNNDTTTASTNNDLTKEHKNIKTALNTGTLDITPSSAYIDDDIQLHLYSSSGLMRSLEYSITVKFNNTTVYTGKAKPSANQNAYVTTTVPNLLPGGYNVTMSWGYSGDFMGATGTTNFTILDASIDVKIAEVGTTTGELGNTPIPIKITDLDGNTVTGTPKINIKDGDTLLVGNYSVVNGEANVLVPTTRIGDYNLTVEVLRDKYFRNCTATLPVHVTEPRTTLNVDQDNNGISNVINVIDNTLLTGNLVQTSNNNAIANVELIVKVNGMEYSILTDDEGKFNFKYTVTQLATNIPVSIQFMGNSLYLASQEVTGAFDIQVLDTHIDLDEVLLSEVNETTTISGTVTYGNNNPVPNAGVTLVITGVENPVTVTTDSQGKFSYDVVYDDVLDVTVVASMANPELYRAQSDTTTFTVVVGPKRTYLTIDTGLGTGTTINIVNVTPYFDEVITNGTLIDVFGEPVVNVPIKILLNGEDYSQVTDSEGKFSLVYNATEGLTTYNLNVEFEGNDAYKPAGEVYTGTFKTEAFDITVTIDDNFPEEILIGDEITITGNATLQNETLRNNPIVLKIDGTQYTTSTDEEGKYSYTYTIARNGTIPIIANATFTNANVKTGQKNIFVDRPLVYVHLDEVENTITLTDVPITGRVYIDSNSTGIETDLIFTINDQTIPLSTNEDGYFNYTFAPPEIGEYVVSISYDNVRYNIQNATTTFIVTKRNTQLVNDKLPVVIRLGDVFTISGTLIDETDAPVDNAEIAFIINGETYTNTTDENGRYEYNYQPSEINDNNLYEVRYYGNSTYDLARNYVGSFFDVELSKATITISADDVILNKLTTVTGLLTDNNNNPISNAEIELVINDEEYTVTTDDEGIYTYTFNATTLGENTVIAIFNNENYAPTSAKTTFQVISTDIVINPIITKANINTTITVNVTASDGSVINEGKVVAKVNGKTIKDANKKIVYAPVSNGQASFVYNFTSAQIANPANVTATYSGSANYPGAHAEPVSVIEDTTRFVDITLGDITASPGETITITTSVKYAGSNVDGGKLTYKVNGKTIRDATTNKVIYETVVDGEASATYTIPSTMRVGSHTLTVTYTGSSYDMTQANVTLNIVKETDTTQAGSNALGVSNTRGDIKTDGATTHVITSDNVDQYITASGLTSLVSPGDTLDIQGTIDKQHSLLINKPINIISSTQDAEINLHTVAGDLSGSNPGNMFQINKLAAGSNISSLYLYNTQLWIYNTHDITLYNMTMYVKDQQVGSGVGQTAIRYSERIIIDSCFIYTQNNGGSTSMALTASSHVLIKNTTIQGVQGITPGPGKLGVGNILYIANRYNMNDKPSDFTVGVDTNITIINSTLLGECIGASTVLVYNNITGSTNCTFINNTFNTTGSYGRLTAGPNAYVEGNKMYGTSEIALGINSTACANEFYDNSKFSFSANVTIYNHTLNSLNVSVVANVYNNTIGTLIVSKNTNVYNNSITTVNMYSNGGLSGNTVTGNVNLDGQTLRARMSNVVIANNIIYGNVVSRGYNTAMKNSNVNITNNIIGGSITLTNTDTHTIEANTINGSISLTNYATNTVIKNNTIITADQYAITNAATSTTITENYLMSNNRGLIGDEAVSDTTHRATIADNGPSEGEFTHITIGDITGTVGDSSSVAIEVTNDIGRSTDGTVYFMVNDEVLVDEDGTVITATVSDNQAVFEFVVPSQCLRSDVELTLVYVNPKYNLTEDTSMDTSKRTATVEIISEIDLVGAGDIITLQARITDNDELVGNGRVVFKLNGISLDDEDNNIYCVDVVEGIATLEYTVKDSISPGDYELEAVFENQLYERSTGSSTLTIDSFVE